MTQKEITNYLNIPLTTLNDWKKTDSARNKLYELLINLDSSIALTILNKKVNHEIFSILNRNIADDSNFTFDEIKTAFSKSSYSDSTPREQIIYAKFFKELDPSELDDFTSTFNVSKRNIKNIYLTSPFRFLSGVSKLYDKRFRVRHANNNLQTSKSKQNIPAALKQLLANKGVVNV